METLLNQIIHLSSELIDEIENKDLEAIDAFMEQRDRLFQELRQRKVSPGQQAALRPLVDHIHVQDQVIISQMVHLREEANMELNKINKGKRSKTMYESSSYGDDSLFFDAKR